MKKILLVDDSADFRDLIRVYVGSLECEIYEAADGDMALFELQQQKFDLVLMDINMPFKDGISVTREFRSSEAVDSYVPILALSAYSGKDFRGQCKDAGFNGFLEKPIARNELIENIREYLKS